MVTRQQPSNELAVKKYEISRRKLDKEVKICVFCKIIVLRLVCEVFTTMPHIHNN